MNPRNLLILLLLLILLGAGLFAIKKSQRTSPPLGSVEISTEPSDSKWATQTNDEANVSVVITPSDPGPQEWNFAVSMNTHSVELDQDMTRVATLVDDQGKELVPLRWEGSPPGGHHRSGKLVFPRFSPTPKSVELKIKGIGEAGERVFKWE